MYRIESVPKSSYPEKDLILSILQKLGGEATVDEIYHLLNGSLSKDVIIGVLCTQNHSMVRLKKWSLRHPNLPIWVYIGQKIRLTDLAK